MPIPTQTIIDRVRNVGLDAEGAEYYDDTIDIIPAINAALEWLIAVINFGLGRKKVSEEVFQDLTFTRIFQVSDFSRVQLDPTFLGHEVWTITAIYPDPVVTPAGVALLALVGPASAYDNRISFVTGELSSKRLTAEEWIENKNNPFEAGNIIMENCADLKTFAYRNYSNYTSAGYAIVIPREIEVRPAPTTERVAIEYARVPGTIASVSDTIDFPDMFTNFIYEKTLNYVSRKQGDNTTIASVTANDLNNLLSSIL